MIKKCIVTFIVGFVLVAVSGVSMISLMAAGFITEDDMHISLSDSSAEYAETTFAPTLTAEHHDDEHHENGGSYSYMEIPAEEAEQIKSLDISLGLGSLYIVEGDIFTLSGDNIGDKNVSYEITDGCFKLDCGTSGFELLNFDFDDESSPDLMLTVPAAVYESLKIDVSAGVLVVDNIETKALDFDISMGESTFTNICASDSANIKMSMGNCYIHNGSLKNPNIKMSAGDMFLEDVALHGSGNIKLSAGELYMGIHGRRSDYKLNVKKSAGEVIIDGADMTELTEISEVSVTQEGDTEYTVTNADTANTLNIKLSAGECTIDFYGNEN